MSIEKKSLISTLKTTKKANIAGAPVVDSGARKETIESTRAIQYKAIGSQKELKMRTLKSLRQTTFKSAKASTKSVN
jgi:hypothetical protein